MERAVGESNLPICIVTRSGAIKSSSFIIQELTNNTVTSVIKDALEAVEGSHRDKKDDALESTSNTDNETAGDSMGGDAAYDERKDATNSQPIFLSSEPTLLELFIEGFTERFSVNETKEQKEYRESLEELEKGLVYEVQKPEIEIAVEVDNSTEAALPYRQDVPILKFSGDLPILPVVSS